MTEDATTSSTSHSRVVQGIRPPQALNLEGNIAENWKLFKQKWNNYYIITRLDLQQQKYQVALLLHTMGDDALKVYNGFQFESDEDERTCQEIIDKFDNFAVGEVNESYERYVFNKRDRKDGESFESFLSAIRTLVKSCNYCENCIDSIVRDRILLGIRDTVIQTALLKERNLTLKTCIDICKANENAAVHSQAIKPEVVNAVSAKSRKKRPNNKVSDCKFCGRRHILKKELCPAFGKKCRICKEDNHFAIKCPKRINLANSDKKHVKQIVQESSDDDYEWINIVHDDQEYINSISKDVKCRMIVNENFNVIFQVDSGASVNIIPKKFVKNEIQPTTYFTLLWTSSRTP